MANDKDRIQEQIFKASWPSARRCISARRASRASTKSRRAKARRNSADTCEIIAKLASSLHEMNNIKDSLGDQMQKAVNNLQRFFQEVIKGRTDYTNLLPMTIGGI